MNKYIAVAAIAAILISACTMRGVRTEDGTINLGPNALGDDPIGHRTYPGYAEYAYATGELKEMEADGLSKEQQICYANAMLGNLPPALANKLNGYARNEMTLMESEYSELSDQVVSAMRSKTVAEATVADFKAKCG